MATQSDASSEAPETGARSRRTQRRLGVRIPIQVLMPGASEPITAMNQDISWGGAQFIASVPGPAVSGRVRLLFPWKSGHRISVEAEVVRAERLDAAHWQIAVRFASLSPRSQSRLEKLLRMLDAEQGVPDDPSADLCPGLEVRVDDHDAMRDLLEQIAAGSLTLVVLEPYETPQSLRLVIRGTGDLPAVRLRARVLEVDRVETGMLPVSRLFSLRLGFEHPPTSVKALVDRLLGKLEPASRESESVFAGTTEWLRDLPFATPIRDRRAVRAREGVRRSVLESRFPDTLKALESAWGDPDRFAACFRGLLPRGAAGPVAWPDDALEELRLLRRLHEAVYGRAASS